MIEDGKYSPLTGTIGFIFSPAHVVAQKFYNWQRPLYKKTKASLEINQKTCSSFDDAMSLLQPLESIASKWLFIPVNHEITAFFSNRSRGLDPTPISPLSVRHCNSRGIRMTLINRKDRGQDYDSRIIELFSPDSVDLFKVERSIYCTNDGGKWKFGTSGVPYSFEKLLKYQEKIIKKRFEAADLWDFMNQFGIDANDEGFYIGSESKEVYEVVLEGELLPNRAQYKLTDIK